MVQYLVNFLLNEGVKVATLSRGYKRKTKGFILADGSSDAEQIGDEPLIYHTNYKIPVAVDANRVNGIKKLSKLDNPPHTIILDDAFQHRWVKCGFNVLVTDYSNPYFSDNILPLGTLREHISNRWRADVIVVTKTPENTKPIDLRNFIKDISPLIHQRVFFSYLKYGALKSVFDSSKQISVETELYKYHVVLITGIANPKPMVVYLKEFANEVFHFPFEDHHEFFPKEVADLQRFYDQIQAENKIIITTEKDFMRMKSDKLWSIVSKMNLYILPVEITFKENEEEFNEVILKYVRTNKFYHHKYSN
jgi:tetraacyldisaccharide 4'-kinase